MIEFIENFGTFIDLKEIKIDLYIYRRKERAWGFIDQIKCWWGDVTTFIYGLD